METIWTVGALLGSVFAQICLGYPLNFNTNATDTHQQFLTGLVAILLTVCCVVLLLGCLCCQRRGGFKEFRDSPVVASTSNLDHGHVNPLTNGEFTIFTPLSPPHQNNNVFLSNQQLITRQEEDYKHGDIDVHSWFDGSERDFPRSRLKYIRELGKGWFGRVVEGAAQDLYSQEDTSWTPVAVRILDSSASTTERIIFLHDASIYRCAEHSNILQLHGRCLDTIPLLLLQEYCPKGDLKKYLKGQKSNVEEFLHSDLPLLWCCQLTGAVKHLHQHNIVHPDLAARNCQITSDLNLKVGDYGLSVTEYPDDYYLASPGVSVRWCAPESIESTQTTIQPKQTTMEVNIWSLGVTLWEICECGEQPYSNLTDDEVVSQVLAPPHLKLSRPTYCVLYTDYLYRLMQLCWSTLESRPRISQIDLMLTDLMQVYQHTKTRNNEHESIQNFDERWNNLKPNVNVNISPKSISQNQNKTLSSSLDNLHDSYQPKLSKNKKIKSENQLESWIENLARNSDDLNYIKNISDAINNLDETLALENTSSSDSSKESTPELQKNKVDFKLGVVENKKLFFDDNAQFDSLNNSFYNNQRLNNSGSDTEDENWKLKVIKGVYSEKVKLKSRSVADLMVLTHIDCSESDSETPLNSLDGKNGRFNNKKTLENANLIFGSEGNLLSLTNNFEKELKELQEKRKDSLNLTLENNEKLAQSSSKIDNGKMDFENVNLRKNFQKVYDQEKNKNPPLQNDNLRSNLNRSVDNENNIENTAILEDLNQPVELQPKNNVYNVFSVAVKSNFSPEKSKLQQIINLQEDKGLFDNEKMGLEGEKMTLDNDKVDLDDAKLVLHDLDEEMGEKMTSAGVKMTSEYEKISLDNGKVDLDNGKMDLDNEEIGLNEEMGLGVEKVTLGGEKRSLDDGKVVLDVEKVVLDEEKVVLVKETCLDMDKNNLEAAKIDFEMSSDEKNSLLNNDELLNKKLSNFDEILNLKDGFYMENYKVKSNLAQSDSGIDESCTESCKSNGQSDIESLPKSNDNLSEDFNTMDKIKSKLKGELKTNTLDFDSQEISSENDSRYNSNNILDLESNCEVMGSPIEENCMDNDEEEVLVDGHLENGEELALGCPQTDENVRKSNLQKSMDSPINSEAHRSSIDDPCVNIDEDGLQLNGHLGNDDEVVLGHPQIDEKAKRSNSNKILDPPLNCEVLDGSIDDICVNIDEDKLLVNGHLGSNNEMALGLLQIDESSGEMKNLSLTGNSLITPQDTLMEAAYCDDIEDGSVENDMEGVIINKMDALTHIMYIDVDIGKALVFDDDARSFDGILKGIDEDGSIGGKDVENNLENEGKTTEIKKIPKLVDLIQNNEELMDYIIKTHGSDEDFVSGEFTYEDKEKPTFNTSDKSDRVVCDKKEESQVDNAQNSKNIDDKIKSEQFLQNEQKYNSSEINNFEFGNTLITSTPFVKKSGSSGEIVKPLFDFKVEVENEKENMQFSNNFTEETSPKKNLLRADSDEKSDSTNLIYSLEAWDNFLGKTLEKQSEENQKFNSENNFENFNSDSEPMSLIFVEGENNANFQLENAEMLCGKTDENLRNKKIPSLPILETKNPNFQTSIFTLSNTDKNKLTDELSPKIHLENSCQHNNKNNLSLSEVTNENYIPENAKNNCFKGLGIVTQFSEILPRENLLGNVTFVKENDASNSENKSFNNENNTYVKENGQFDDENRTFIKENATFIKENDTYIKENANKENQTIIKENDELIGEIDDFVKENATFTKESDKVSGNETFIKENATFIGENATFIKENATFIRENSKINEENDTFLRENCTFTKENDTFVRENITFTKENESFPLENTLFLKENTLFLKENSISTNKTVANYSKNQTNENLIENDVIINPENANDTLSTWEPTSGWFLHPQTPPEDLEGTITLKEEAASDSYVGFSMDDEIMAAIRNELMMKLPQAQRPPEAHPDDENEEEPVEKNEVFIHYNIYNTPLSPIPEESYYEDDSYLMEDLDIHDSDMDSNWSGGANSDTNEEEEEILDAEICTESPSVKNLKKRRNLNTLSQESCCSNDTLFNLEELVQNGEQEKPVETSQTHVEILEDVENEKYDSIDHTCNTESSTAKIEDESIIDNFKNAEEEQTNNLITPENAENNLQSQEKNFKSQENNLKIFAKTSNLTSKNLKNEQECNKKDISLAFIENERKTNVDLDENTVDLNKKIDVTIKSDTCLILTQTNVDNAQLESSSHEYDKIEGQSDVINVNISDGVDIKNGLSLVETDVSVNNDKNNFVNNDGFAGQTEPVKSKQNDCKYVKNINEDVYSAQESTKSEKGDENVNCEFLQNERELLINSCFDENVNKKEALTIDKEEEEETLSFNKEKEVFSINKEEEISSLNKEEDSASDSYKTGSDLSLSLSLKNKNVAPLNSPEDKKWKQIIEPFIQSNKTIHENEMEIEQFERKKPTENFEENGRKSTEKNVGDEKYAEKMEENAQMHLENSDNEYGNVEMHEESRENDWESVEENLRNKISIEKIDEAQTNNKVAVEKIDEGQLEIEDNDMENDYETPISPEENVKVQINENKQTTELLQNNEFPIEKINETQRELKETNVENEYETPISLENVKISIGKTEYNNEETSNYYDEVALENAPNENTYDYVRVFHEKPMGKPSENPLENPRENKEEQVYQEIDPKYENVTSEKENFSEGSSQNFPKENEEFYLENEEEEVPWYDGVYGLADIRFSGPGDQLMSTSFSESNDLDNNEQDWDSGSDTRSSSSGEFIWKEGEHEESVKALHAAPQDMHVDEVKPMDNIYEEESTGSSGSESGEGENTEFVPSAWDMYALPSKSALRSPEKTLEKDVSAKDKKPRGVSFKKQKYHCVYEYPREPESPILQTYELWKPTHDFSTLADWAIDPESYMASACKDSSDEFRSRRLKNLFPTCDIGNATTSNDFFISQNNQHFDLSQSSQFFPGKNLYDFVKINENATPDSGIDDLTPASLVDSSEYSNLQEKNLVQPLKTLAAIAANKNVKNNQNNDSLGGMRHTRNRLKLNLPSSPNSFAQKNFFGLENANTEIIINKSTPTFTTFGKSRFQVQHVDTPPIDEDNTKKNVCFEAIPYKKPENATEKFFFDFEKNNLDKNFSDVPTAANPLKMALRDDIDEEKSAPIEVVRGEASLLDSTDEDSGIESCTLATKN